MPRQRSVTPDESSQEQESLQVGPDGRILGTNEWMADRILDESGKKYLIAWDGINPDTGIGWPPTWESKKEQSSGPLVRQWEEEKKANPNITGRGAVYIQEAKDAERKAKLVRKAAAAAMNGSGRKDRLARRERGSTVSTDAPAPQSRRKEKRKRDSTISTDVQGPPSKRRGRGQGAGGKENPINVDSPDTGRGSEATDQSSELTPPDRPRRAAVPSSKARENAQQVIGAADPGSSSKLSPSSKANGSSSRIASSSKLSKSSSAIKPAVDDAAPSDAATPSTPAAANTPAADSPRTSSHLGNNASPVSKKSTAAKPLPLAPIAVSTNQPKAKAAEKEKEKEAEAALPEEERDQTPSRATRGRQHAEELSSATPPTSPEVPVRKAPTKVSVPSKAPPKPAKAKSLGPVPQLDPDVFQPHLPEDNSKSSTASSVSRTTDAGASASVRHPHGTQSTTTTRTSQTDPIAQFSSPARTPAHPARRARGAAPPAPAAQELEPSAEISPARSKAITETRIIDGSEVTVLVRSDSESSSEEASDETMSLDGRLGGEAEGEGEGQATRLDVGDDVADAENAKEQEPEAPNTSVADMEAVEVSVEETSVIELVPAAESDVSPEKVHGVTLRVVKIEPAETLPSQRTTPQLASDEAAPLAASPLQSHSQPHSQPIPQTLPQTEAIAAAVENSDVVMEEPQLPAGVVIEDIITKTVQDVVRTPAPGPSAIRLTSTHTHLSSRNSRAGSRTSEVRSRNPTPSDRSDSPTKEGSDSLMQNILDDVALKTEEIDRLRNRLDSERENNRFVREQLDRAHAVIGELRQSESQHIDRITLLQEQLKHGLEQQRIFALSVQKKRDEELFQLRAQNVFLLEQSRLTGDVIRQRAAKYPALRREHDQCAGRHQASEERAAGLLHRNNELSEQIALLRAQVMGVMEGEDASEEDPSDLSLTYSSDYDQKRARLANKAPAPPPRDAREVLLPEDTIKRCAFAEVDGGCDLVFTNDEAHLQHILEHKARLNKDPFPVPIADMPT